MRIGYRRVHGSKTPFKPPSSRHFVDETKHRRRTVHANDLGGGKTTKKTERHISRTAPDIQDKTLKGFVGETAHEPIDYPRVRLLEVTVRIGSCLILILHQLRL
jgi:hypothetical protein